MRRLFHRIRFHARQILTLRFRQRYYRGARRRKRNSARQVFLPTVNTSLKKEACGLCFGCLRRETLRRFSYPEQLTMRAVCWNGRKDVRVETVDDPRLLNPRDAIIATELTAICGSDLHLYNGNIPTMQSGDILRHEFVGRVIEVGPEVDNLQAGDRVAVPFPIACGRCFYCSRGAFSFCDNSNPNAWMAEKVYGYSPAGLFGYSHMLGGYAGGQAEYVRVPYADVGPVKVPSSLSA